MTRTILWLGLISSMIFFVWQSLTFTDAKAPGILEFEYANSIEAISIIQSWQAAGLINTVRKVTHYDFVFILIYTLLMIGCSNDQMTQERNRLLNTILRLNILISVFVPLFDITENLFLLYNIEKHSVYLDSYWITKIKFGLAIWIVGIWLLSKIRTQFQSRSSSIA